MESIFTGTGTSPSCWWSSSLRSFFSPGRSESDSDVPLVRVWAVTAVTPVASAIESVRNGTTGFFSNYFELRNAREQSRQLRTEVDKLRVENQLLKNELGSAQRGTVEVYDANRKSRTVLKLEKLEYNLPMKDEDFTLEALRRG